MHIFVFLFLILCIELKNLVMYFLLIFQEITNNYNTVGVIHKV